MRFGPWNSSTMSAMKVVQYCLLATLVMLLLCTDTCTSSPIERSKRFELELRPEDNYCGPKLSETLSRICNGIYNTRGEFSSLVICGKTLSHVCLPSSSDAHNGDQDPLSRFNYSISGPDEGSKRLRRGVIDDCCRRPCSPKTLRTYCSGDSSR